MSGWAALADFFVATVPAISNVHELLGTFLLHNIESRMCDVVKLQRLVGIGYGLQIQRVVLC